MPSLRGGIDVVGSKLIEQEGSVVKQRKEQEGGEGVRGEEVEEGDAEGGWGGGRRRGGG